MLKGSSSKREGQGVKQDDNDKAQKDDQELSNSKSKHDSNSASSHLNSMLDSMSSQSTQKLTKCLEKI